MDPYAYLGAALACGLAAYLTTALFWPQALGD